jgi:hypothetical protein
MLAWLWPSDMGFCNRRARNAPAKKAAAKMQQL